jgi:hypothetical protein
MNKVWQSYNNDFDNITALLKNEVSYTNLCISTQLAFLASLQIHINVVIVYIGIKSPITGINLIKLIAVDLLFLVIANNKAVTNALGISPTGGTLKIGLR